MFATQNVRVLVVNDDPSVPKTIGLLLGDMGVQARGFTDPVEFLKVAKQEGCDIALVNFRMPKLDGIQVIEELRKMDTCMFIILDTAYPQLEVLVDALRVGADEMLPMPFKNKEVLEATVKRAHHRWAARGRSDVPSVASAQATAGTKGPAERGKTLRDRIVIYAVDDEPVTIRLFRLLLEDSGYKSFRGFHEPDAIVEAAADEPCHIALVNLRMPRSEDGIGAVRALREISPWMHIILDTAYPDLDAIIEAARAGANDVVVGPYIEEEVSEAIERGCLRLGIAPAAPPG
ncbi:MAG: response regulator [Planctomycetota bacterium]